MASLAEVNFKISGNIEEFQTAMRKAQKSFETFGKGMKQAGTTLSMGLTVPILALGAASLKTAGDVEQTQKTFEVLLKSADAAGKMVSSLQKFSAETPFEFMQTKDYATSLLAVGIAAKDIIPTLTHLGDISMGNPEKFQRLTEAFSKMKAKGKSDMEQLNRFTEAGVPIIQALADKFKITTAEVFKLSDAGKIGFNDVNQAIINMTTNGGQFEGMMKKQNSSITGIFSNMMDTISASLAKFGLAISKALDLKDLVPKLSGWIQGLTDAFDNLSPSTQKFIVIAAGITAALGPVLLGIGFLASNVIPLLISGVGVAIGAMGGLSVAFEAASVAIATNPLAVWFVGIAAACLVAKEAFNMFSVSQKDAVVSSTSFMSTLLGETSKLELLFKSTQSATEGTMGRKRGIDEINSAYGSYLPKLLTEKSTLDEISKAQKIATSALMENIAAKAKEKDQLKALDKIDSKREAFNDYLKENIKGDATTKNMAQVEPIDFLMKLNPVIDAPGQEDLVKRLTQQFSDKFSKKYKLSSGYIYTALTLLIEENKQLSSSYKEIDKYYDFMLKRLKPVTKGIQENTEETKKQDEATKNFTESLRGQKELIMSLQEKKKVAKTPEEKIKIDDEIKAAQAKVKELNKVAEATGLLGVKEREIQALQKLQVNTNNPAEIKSIQDKIAWINIEIECLRKYGQTAEQVFGMTKKQLDRMSITPLNMKGSSKFNNDSAQYGEYEGNNVLNKMIPLTDLTKNMDLSDPSNFKAFDAAIAKMQDKVKTAIIDISGNIKDLMGAVITSVAESLGNMLGGDKSNIGDLFVGVLNTIGSFLKQLGTMMIATGIAFLKFEASLASMNPFLMIAIGAGAVLAGAAVSTFAKKGLGKGFTNGGIASGNSLTGDLIPIRVNSKEMILNMQQQANLFALANGGGVRGGSGGTEIFGTFRVDGKDLVLAISNYNKKLRNQR